MQQPDIIYTIVDEAPELASASLLPMIQTFTQPAGIAVGTKDISVSARILALWNDRLTPEQQQPDDLAELGETVAQPEAIVIKLPNISATVSQLTEAIAELQGQGYAIPDYPDSPENDDERAIKAKYDTVIGSVVNPVLRKGNSQRLIPAAVKADAQRNPHPMGKWLASSKTHVAHMSGNDFCSSEKSHIIAADTAGTARIEFVGDDGKATTLKDDIILEVNDVVDAAALSRQHLASFLEEKITEAKQAGLLLSVHLKATMMIKTDGVIFGDVVAVYFKDVFAKHAAMLDELGVDPKNGIGDIEAKIGAALDDPALSSEQQAALKAKRKEIAADVEACLNNRADLAMVNPKAGVTNLDSPNLVIMDVSMANVARWAQMEDASNTSRDTMAVIPDGTYAAIYQEAIDFFKQNGALDPKTMGSVDNIGLMANKAEEYGSKDKTFEAPGNGVIRIVVGSDDKVLEQHSVSTGDIWRMSQTKDDAIANWVKLGIDRARRTGTPAVFWLDSKRSHDAKLIQQTQAYLKDHDTDGLVVEIMASEQAMRYTLERMLKGEHTISVTGNVLRDYLTDLFPILEVGSSAKMLSLIPLLNGGLLAETGSGGTAPKHQAQLVEEGHLRWNSLGEFLALIESLRHLGDRRQNAKADILADTLEQATNQLLETGKMPSARGMDTRESHYFLALYWAQALAAQSQDSELQSHFVKLAQQLADEKAVIAEIKANKQAVDLKGHFNPSREVVVAAMRPSAMLNSVFGGVIEPVGKRRKVCR